MHIVVNLHLIVPMYNSGQHRESLSVLLRLDSMLRSRHACLHQPRAHVAHLLASDMTESGRHTCSQQQKP